MLKKIGIAVLSIGAIGYIIPQNFSMPVEGATNNDYHRDSFWYYPWGKSGTHKGVDIFARRGTNVRTSTSGFVLYTGNIKIGGNVMVVLGPKWRLHYYAHLDEITSGYGWLTENDKIGTVGTSGNAQGKPPHLHYAIITPIPYFWRVDNSRQGYKKMFYLNPIDFLHLSE